MIKYLVALFLLISLVGCTTRTIVITEQELQQRQEANIHHYGNNLYYFPFCTYTENNDWPSNTFIKVLSQYIDRHPELEVVSICANGTGMHGRDLGYYVVMRPKAKALDKADACCTIVLPDLKNQEK